MFTLGKILRIGSVFNIYWLCLKNRTGEHHLYLETWNAFDRYKKAPALILRYILERLVLANDNIAVCYLFRNTIMG